MGSELVESYPPSEGDGNIAFSSIRELFEDQLPQYMAMGLTYEEFWYGDPYKAKAIRDTYKLKRSLENQNMWLQGVYVYQALVSASPLFAIIPKEPFPYMDNPIPLDEKEEQELEENKERKEYEDNVAKMKQMIGAVNQTIKRKEVASNE